LNLKYEFNYWELKTEESKGRGGKKGVPKYINKKSKVYSLLFLLIE
jgi:hypothetical protein